MQTPFYLSRVLEKSQKSEGGGLAAKSYTNVLIIGWCIHMRTETL